MKERKISSLQILFMVLCGIVMILGSSRLSLADVAVGDVIDKTNWQKAQGLLPDAMLEYLQKGYFTIKVGKLNYEPGDVMTSEFKESMQKNAGRYSVNAKGEIVDNKTGQADPMDIIGIPFPNLDVKDPHFSEQTMYNHMFIMHSRGAADVSSTFYFVGQKMERYISGPTLSLPFTGSARLIARQPQTKTFGKRVEAFFIMKVTDPYELNGLATMTYSFRGNDEPDKVFAYVPALRRARILSASARSDAMFGTDYALDDASGFIGKPRDFDCKYLRTQDGLVRFNSPDIIDAVQRPDGSYELKKPYPFAQFGFQTPGWQGKAWAVTNQIWVKRKVHVMECRSKDPYYNYGKFELWYEPKWMGYVHKVIWDRAGKRWKVMNMGNGTYRAKDGAIGKTDAAFGDWIYDEQRDHTTCILEFSPKERKIFNANLTADMFTMNGMIKFAK